VFDVTVIVGWVTLDKMAMRDKEAKKAVEQHEVEKKAALAQEAMNRQQHKLPHEKKKSTPKHSKPVVINQPKKWAYLR